MRESYEATFPFPDLKRSSSPVQDYVTAAQLTALDGLLTELLPRNQFQRARLGDQRSCRSVADFLELPLMHKRELVHDAAAHPPFGTNLTYPLARYIRYHQTSGTTGVALPVLDTAESWAWWSRCWQAVYSAGGITSQDRLFFAFSFGPFIGFWSAHEGATDLGALCLPGGGASSIQRLRLINSAAATVLVTTPSYALRLAEVAAAEGIDLRASTVRLIIVAGEPGGSIPATRVRIAEAWDADVLDHAGATEIGAWGIGCRNGLVVNETEFIAEVIDSGSGEHVPPGSGRTGELVLTNLGRSAWPVIRYRTGDVVRPIRGTNADGVPALVLEGGILGRTDDMITIRGINVFPSAIEDVVRAVAQRAEFRITATQRGPMDELEVEVEGDADLCEQIIKDLRLRIGLRVHVRPVASGALPRWEGKARRFVKVFS
jgi:phenylacetate-CoA ligase